MKYEDQKQEAMSAGGVYSTGVDHPTSTQAVPTLSAAAVQRSFSAATSQLNALARFGANPVSVEERSRATEEISIELKERFLKDGFFELEANGVLHEVVQYLRAVKVIQAKAAALGYGSESQSVAITSVPGGYVGRFGGNDIYAAAK